MTRYTARRRVVFDHWLRLPGWAILLTLVLFFALTTLGVHRVCFAPGGRPRLSGLFGIVPPFLAAPTILFALMGSFLANDAWEHARQAGRAVLDDEWGLSDERGSPAAQSALDALVRAVGAPAIAQEVGPTVQAALLAAASRIASSRSSRLALQTDEGDDAKWTTVICLALVAQAAIGVVHLDRARPQIAALLLFSCCAVAMLTLIAVCERPYDGSHQVTSAPLQSVLPP
jgi:hypothetical protein